MKRILALLTLTIGLAARAADGTNITFKVTVDSTVGGVTTTTTSTLKLDGGTAKDILLADALIAAHAKAVKDGSRLSLADWLKTDIKDRAMDYVRAKLTQDNAAIISKIQTLLTQQQDQLSAQDISNLNAISAKAQ